jgi:DNA helicase-2/ATP-dependent DNA helicase PcrA
MKSFLTPEELAIVAEEEAVLRTVIIGLQLQEADQTRRLTVETNRARRLTHELVASRRFEEKASLGDQERLSHTLKERSEEEVERLHALLNRPYFARLVIREESDTGPVEREFKVGHHPNGDCRIVDWKKAPLSKLYYHYKEGDEFAEEIQGTDRYGTVILRRQVEIEHGILRRITHSQGALVLTDDGWRKAGDPAVRSSAPFSASSSLPDVLSFISAAQFDAITRDAQSPVLIQGVAGSGKTTVALHRAAWLFSECREEISPDRSAIVVLNPLLRSYIRNSLEKLSIPGVTVYTLPEWTSKTLNVGGESRATTAVNGSAASVAVRTSVTLLRQLEPLIRDHKFLDDYPGEKIGSLSKGFLESIRSLLIAALSSDWNPHHKGSRKPSPHMDGIGESIDYYSSVQADDFDRHDLMLALWIQLEALRIGKDLPFEPIRYDAIIADEVQDLNGVELSCIALAAKNSRGLTLVGDSAQQTERPDSLPGWSFVREVLRKPNEPEVSLIHLTVPYRCTLPIMQFAAACRGDELPAEGRTGPRPLWVRCKREEIGHAQMIQWLTHALQVHPGTLCSVLCASREEARIAASLLKPTFGNLLELADPSAFTLDEGILVSDISLAKGLEFSSVALWNPSKKRLPDSPLSANLLYVAATRAQDELCVISWEQPSPRLPGFHSALVNAYTTDNEEPVETENHDHQ